MQREDNKAHKGEGAAHRHARLQSLFLEELRALLRDDVSDPALVDVRITAVVVSVDYKHARVHFAVRGESPGIEAWRRHAEGALARASAFFRARLAEAIDLKRVPDLRFVFDGVASPDAEGVPVDRLTTRNPPSK